MSVSSYGETEQTMVSEEGETRYLACLRPNRSVFSVLLVLDPQISLQRLACLRPTDQSSPSCLSWTKQTSLHRLACLRPNRSVFSVLLVLDQTDQSSASCLSSTHRSVFTVLLVLDPQISLHRLACLRPNRSVFTGLDPQIIFDRRTGAARSGTFSPSLPTWNCGGHCSAKTCVCVGDPLATAREVTHIPTSGQGTDRGGL